MNNNSATEHLVFEVITPLGFTVRLTRAYWELIVTMKHPIMSGHESDVKETLATQTKFVFAAVTLPCIRFLSPNDLVDGFVQWQKELSVRALC